MTLEKIKEFEDLYCKVVGFSYLDSMTMDKVVYGGITVNGEYVTITDKNGDELEIHFEEIKEITIL